MAIQPWRATCIQMRSQVATHARSRAEAWETIARNLAHATALIDDVCRGEQRPALVLLPEFGFQGPPHHEGATDWIEKACYPVPGDISAPLQAKAREYGIYVGANQFEFDPEWPGRYFNSSYLIDPRGEVILRYRRINTAQWPSPHDFMDAYFARYGVAGTFPVVATELGNLAMLPCGELMVPEATRVLMMRGAEVLLHPTNEQVGPGQDAAKVLRAAENMMYLVSANVAGPIGFAQGETPQGGRSRIVDFDGRDLAFEPGAEETTEVSAVLDVEALRAARRGLAMRNRLLRSRFEIYLPVYQDAVIYPANQFLDTPMPHWDATAPVAQVALENLVRRGIAVPE